MVNPLLSSSVSLEIMGRSHMALLIAFEQPFQVPAKIFEYMAAKIPILALADDGATKDLMKEVGIGKAFCMNEIESIKYFILYAINNYDSLNIMDNDKFRSYERKQLTSVLSQIISKNNVDIFNNISK